MGYHSHFRMLGKKKTIFEKEDIPGLEQGEYVIFDKKTYKIVHKKYDFDVSDNFIRYEVVLLPKHKNKFLIWLNEVLVSILALFHKL